MHYIFYLKIDGFFAHVLLNGDPQLSGKSVVVHHQKRVLDCNAHASEQGVRPGMSLSEAKAIGHGATLIPYAEEDYRKEQEVWLDRCADISDCIEPDGQDACYCHLCQPNPADLCSNLIEHVSNVYRLPVRGSLAQVKWIAKIAALTSREGLTCIDSGSSFVKGLEIDQLLPVPPEHRQRLKFLGYRKVGSLLEVSLETLKGQFGDEGLTIHAAARGGVRTPVKPCYPSQSIANRVVFESPVEDLEAIDRSLKALSFTLGRRLLDAGQQCNHVEAWLSTGNEITLNAERVFTKPMRTPPSIYAALKLLFKPLIEQIEDGVTCLRVRLQKLTEAKETQAELVKPSHALSSSNRERNHTGIETVRQVFGDASIQLASGIVEPRRKAVLRYWKNVTGWV